jgi:RNA polymerase sigma factor (sigma-70 family)
MPAGAQEKNNFFLMSDETGIEVITDDDVISKLSADEIYRFITQMPVGYRTVFNLYVIEGYSHAEIAVILNISEGTSKSQLNRAKKTLQQSVTQNNLYAERKAK